MNLVLRKGIDRPDFNFLLSSVQRSMDAGIQVDIDAKLKSLIEDEYIASREAIGKYGIDSIKDTKVIQDVFERQAKKEERNGKNSILRETCYDKELKKWDIRVEKLVTLAQQNNKLGTLLLSNIKLSNYMAKISSIEEYTDDKGLIHPVITTSSTNRIQYVNPGLLTIPKAILWHIIKPHKGYSLYSIDIQNQEPWILINMLNISSLKELLSISEDGLYEIIFDFLYNRTPNKIERNELKKAWNALTYGASKKAINCMCKHIDSSVLYNFFKNIPGYKEYSSEKYAFANASKQHSATSYFGTPVNITGETASKRAKQMMNAGIQGTGADILAFLVKHFLTEVSKEGLENDLRLYFTRHDECIVEVSNTFEDKYTEDGVIDILADVFEHRIDNWEPFRLKVLKIVPTTDTIFKPFDDSDYDD